MATDKTGWGVGGGTLDGSPYQYGDIYYPPEMTPGGASSYITRPASETKDPNDRGVVGKTIDRKGDLGGDLGAKHRQGLIDMMTSLGLQGDVWDKLVDESIQEGWTDEQFWSKVRESDTFQHAFPGIELPNGKMRMSPVQYIQTRLSYKQQAREIGLHISNEQFGKAIGHNMSAQEFSDRLTAVQAVKENHQQWVEFARFSGLDSSGKAAMDFMLGTAPKQFYTAWEKAQIANEAYNAGIGIGTGAGEDALSKQDVSYMAKMNPGWDPKTAKEDMKKLATLMMNEPSSRLYGFGFSKIDLMKAVAGGDGSDEVLARLARAQKTISANINAKPDSLATAEVDKKSQLNVKGD